MKKKNNFFYNNGLSIAFLILTVITLTSQVFTGLSQYNEFLNDHHKNSVGVSQYLCSGHFLEATFENWESEFLQMALFVVLTIFLRQQGSSESKKLNGPEKVDREPSKKRRYVPGPLKRVGWFLRFTSIPWLLLCQFYSFYHLFFTSTEAWKMKMRN